MDIDLVERAARRRTPTATPVFLRDIWPTPAGGRARRSSRRSSRTCSARATASVFDGRRALARRSRSRPATASRGTTTRPTCSSPPYFEGMPREPAPVTRHRRRARARAARRLRHDRPHLAGRLDQARQPGRRATCIEHGVEPQRLQLLRRAPRQPRGDDARHVREHPPAQPARAGHRGRRHARTCPDGERDVDLRRRDAVRRGGRRRSSCSPARSTARARRATGRRRARTCSACAP